MALRKRTKIILIIVIIIVVAIIIIGSLAKSSQKAEYTTYTTQYQTLKQSVDASGKIESAEEIELNFKISGRLNQVLVEPGDEVRAGQVLARLEAGALQSQVNDARARVVQAQADYEKLVAGASSEDVQVTEDTVAQRQQDLIAAENNLENLKAKRDTELNNLREAAVNTLKNEIITAKGSLEEVDNTLNDDDAEDTLSVQNRSALDTALYNQIAVFSLVNQSQDIIDSIDSNSSDQQILDALDELKFSSEGVAKLLSNTLDVLSYTITSSNLTESELDALKTTIKAQQTAINNSRTTIQTAKSNWTNKVVYYQDQVTIYEDNIAAAQKNLNLAESQLELKKSPPRKFEIDYAKSRITQAQAALTLALDNLNQAIITAPLDGTITKKHFKVGEQTSLASPVLEMIGESNLQIEVDIPESDIAKVAIGQEVDITLDAFSDDEIFKGKVTFVDPAETVIQDVVYYKVKIQLDELGENIKPGMTANAVICTNKKDNVLSVPARAIRATNGDKYVEVLVNEQPVQKNVTTGLRGDEGIEITSGLDEGDEVITFVKE